MTDQWGIDKLDIDAYLRRIGPAFAQLREGESGAGSGSRAGERAAGGQSAGRPGNALCKADLSANGKSLSALHRAHVATIPFENLDVILKRGISVALDDIQAKLVTAGRGGYCFEQNLLFASVLERLGFIVTRLLARVGDGRGIPSARSHVLLQVRGDEGEWLADVGFGAELLMPLTWADTNEQQQGSWSYRMLPSGRSWQVQSCAAGKWTSLYQFSEEPQHLADMLTGNWYTSTYPTSSFVRQPVVMRKSEDSLLRLKGRELATVMPDGDERCEEISDAAYADVLGERFGLVLTEEELGIVLGSC